MTKGRLPRERTPRSPQHLIDLRLLVLLALAGLIGWLAVVRPVIAGAIAAGLTALVLLQRLVGR